MSSNKYEDRVTERAFELAKSWEENNITAKDPDYFDLMVIEFMPLARLSVQREAEMFKIGFLIDRLEDFDNPQIDILLNSLGLIPPPNEPA